MLAILCGISLISDLRFGPPVAYWSCEGRRALVVKPDRGLVGVFANGFTSGWCFVMPDGSRL